MVPTPTFERFRRTRHSAQYFDPDAVPITEADATWAIEKATSSLEEAKSLLAKSPPGRFSELPADRQPDQRSASNGVMESACTRIQPSGFADRHLNRTAETLLSYLECRIETVPVRLA